MCGLVGFVNLKKDISNDKNVLELMNNTLTQRGPDEFGYYTQKHVMLGHRRLIIRDPEGRQTTNDFKICFWRICNCL